MIDTLDHNLAQQVAKPMPLPVGFTVKKENVSNMVVYGEWLGSTMLFG
jgi:hypothetical protein